jgi:hypothetical protein
LRRLSGQPDVALGLDRLTLRVAKLERIRGEGFSGKDRLLRLADVEVSDGKSGADESGGKRRRDEDELRLLVS